MFYNVQSRWLAATRTCPSCRVRVVVALPIPFSQATLQRLTPGMSQAQVYGFLVLRTTTNNLGNGVNLVDLLAPAIRRVSAHSL